ncbi:tetratricopeptide repeat-containing sensor histidine kinase [Chitinophaga oryzae]|uniref:histidine kinase n=1 Tax=Chitinophaga oryzae TaxID=2725414 RepID=A0AAE6ZFZ8_9BACT|nr:sensor histidine kinase [Chitinophaga oryzae]QJB31148.1 tetratricopeptide repeat-containing sensor histidine kinase [Chitinophaga oryzae]QJB37634.1 tetratricopeptide repeat-containing sensor histidine kinase [Chitinophaga oryzae]
MKRFFAVPVVALLWATQLLASPGPVPGPIYSLLRQRCSICSHKPADSASLILYSQYPAPYLVHFHNSHVSLRNRDPDNAYRYILKTLEDIDNAPTHPLYPYAFFLRAGIQYNRQLYKEALQDFLRLSGTKGLDPRLLAACYINIAEISLELRHFNTALQYFNKWESRFMPLADLQVRKSVCHNKGLCFFHMGMFREAEKYLLQSQEMERQLKDTTGLAISSMDIGNLYYEQYLDSKAIPYFEAGLRFAQQSGDLAVRRNAYRNMAVVEENRKRHYEALQYRKHYETLQDSIWNRDHIWEMAKLEKKLAVEKRELAIRVLEQQAGLQSAALSAQRWQRNTLLVAVAALMCLSALAGYAYRQQKKNTRIVAEQRQTLHVLNETKDRLFSIVAHDLRSPVYRMKISLGRLRKAIRQSRSEEAEILASGNEKIAGSTYALLDNLLHWALSQTGQLFFRKEKLHLLTVINQVCYDLLPVAEDKNIMVHLSVPEQAFFIADLNTFRIMVRNILDNAIKYTPAGGAVTISAAMQNNGCQLVISDTGIGMDQQLLHAIMTDNHVRNQTDTDGRQSTGLGLWLCKTLAERNGAQLLMAAQQGIGTTVTIFLQTEAS